MQKRLLFSISLCALYALLIPQHLIAQASTSVLSEGKFYKVAVTGQGIYKLDASFLSNTAGINLSQTAASQITLWTNGGGMLPQKTTAPRIDDLREVAMYGIGTADGKVDAGDYFLFYAEGPDQWAYSDTEGRFRKTKNIYDTRNYYFICVSNREATAIQSRNSLDHGDITLTTYDARQSIDDDKVNLLGKFRPPGSGQRWFGDEFSSVRQRSYQMTFPDIVAGSPVSWIAEFAGRSDATTSVTVDFNGNPVTKVISSVVTGNVEAQYAAIVRLAGVYPATGSLQDIAINYPQGSTTSSGWLDFIEAQASCQLQYDGQPLEFRSVASRGYETAEYQVSGVSGNEILWDISDPQRPVSQQYKLNAGIADFAVASDTLIHEFIVFTPGTGYPTPQGVGNVPNQNLHSIEDADLVIIYHPDFKDAVMRLASHRLDYDGYLVEAIPVGQVMNEFAGGGQDPTAIRDFARMLKKRSDRFRFLLLFGDGTYDMRHLNTELADENYIPVFETPESMNPITAFPCDDYFALLSDDEGNDLKGAIDIAVGRIPVRTADEANLVVDKLIHYDDDPATFGDWRLGITYVADDEDGNQHLDQTEDIATTQQNAYPQYNIRKIYLDAYPQISTPGGQRYPDVNAAINDAIQRGTLILNYLGHGGPSGWSQERVLGVSDIQAWTNYNKLPVFITATCSFTPYDEPSLRSAGELVLLNSAGGAVTLLTTVRAVYSSSNKRLTSEVFSRILQEENGSVMPLGQVMMLAKNSNHSDTTEVNARKFAIIGDPSLRLMVPENQIVVTKVNGLSVISGVPDTAQALEEVHIDGEVRDMQGQKLSQFNGTLTATVFDKPSTAKTLANDNGSYVQDFQTQTKVLFKGPVSVKEGTFSLTFVVPQDISFQYGKAKVSLYATDGTVDAAGYYDNLVVGGGNTQNVDQDGPEIQIYADNEHFKSGGNTGPNPMMLVMLSDESGINITGNSIGHDLEGTLDDNQRNTYNLNNLYIAAIDDHTRGEVQLPLSDLSPGIHTFKVVAWDIADNYSESEITFRVVDDPHNVILNLHNRPNPFRFSTEFAFDHRLGDVPVNAEIQIFSVAGRMVQDLHWDNMISEGGTVEGLEWDGSAMDGGFVLPGAYLYRVKLVSQPGTSQEHLYQSKFGKLIVVN